MAKIPQYTSTLSPSGQTQGGLPGMPGTGAEAIGRGLSAVGDTLNRMGVTQRRLDAEAELKAQRLQEDRDKQWALNATTRYQTRLAERQFEEEQAMPPGALYDDGTTYVDRAKTIFEEEELALESEAPTEQAKELFKASAFQISEREYVASLGTQAKEAARFAIDQEVNGSQDDINLLIKRPELLAEVWTRRKETIESLTNIGERTKQAIIEKIGPSYATLQLQKDLNDVKLRVYDPNKIVADIDSGVYEKQMKDLGLSIPPEQLQNYRDKALSLVKTIDDDTKYQLTKEAEDLVTDATLTGKVPPEDTYDRFAVKGESFVSALRDKVDLAAKTAGIRKNIVLDPVGFAKNQLPKLQPKPGEESTKQVAIYDAAVTALQLQQKQLKEDPGAAATEWFNTVSNSTDPGVEKAMLTAIARSSDEPGALPFKITLNTDPMTGELDTRSATAMKVAYLRTQGLSDRQIKVLSKDQAKSIVDNLQKPDILGNQGGYETVRQGLDQLKIAYGPEFFPKVMNELTEQGLPQAYSALMWAEGSVYTNKMIAALQTPVTTYEKNVGLPAAELGALKQTISQEMAPYTNPLRLGAPNGERANFINGVNDLIYKVVMQQKSVDPNTNMVQYTRDIVKELVHNRFTVTDTQTIPKTIQGVKIDSDIVQSRLDAFKGSISIKDISENFASGLPQDVTKQVIAETIKSSGYWVTNSTSSGAYLVIDIAGYTAQPVLGPDGSRIEKMYKDLSSPLYNSSPVKPAAKPATTKPRARITE